MSTPRFWIAIALLALVGCKGAKDEDAGADATPAEEPTTAPAEVATPEPSTPDPGAFPSERVQDTFATSAAAGLGSCETIRAADLVGDEADEVICTRSNELIVYGADGQRFRQRLSILGTGLLNASWSGDRDGDGKQELLVAFGMGRGFATAPIKVVELDAEAGGGGWTVRTLFQTTGARPQVSSLWGPRIYLAHFVSKYEVTGGFVQPDGTLSEERLIHMGMARVWSDLDGDGADELAVGRVYGDLPKSDGDLTVYDGDEVHPVPTVRGVRQLTTGDLDGDGKAELVFGDGWHFKYRDEGKGRLNVASRDAASGAYQTELIHELPGQFAVMRLALQDLDADGALEILASGATHVYRVDRVGSGAAATWDVKELGAVQPSGEFAAVRRPGGAIQVAVAGAPVTWLDL